MPTNRELVESWYKALETGDLDLFQSVQSPDVIYDISGHSVISGRFHGLDNLMEKILPVVFGGIDFESFQFCRKLKIMAEDDNCIVAIMEADGKAMNGKRYDQRYAQFFNFSDGKISRVIEFFDTALAAESILEGADKVQPDAAFEV